MRCYGQCVVKVFKWTTVEVDTCELVTMELKVSQPKDGPRSPSRLKGLGIQASSVHIRATRGPEPMLNRCFAASCRNFLLTSPSKLRPSM